MKLTPQISVTLGNQKQTRTNDTNTPDATAIDWDVVGQKAAIFQQTAETLGKLAFGAYAAKKLVDTVCEIAVIAATRKL
jgi:hypothetical protein